MKNTETEDFSSTSVFIMTSTVVYSNKFEYMDGRENLRDTVVERGFKLL